MTHYTNTNTLFSQFQITCNEAIAKLDNFFKELENETNPLNQERHKLLPNVVTVIRSIENRLVEILDGNRLRGVPNLLTPERKLLGWNVRKLNKSTKLRIPREDDETTETLLLVPDGGFAIAEVSLGRSKETTNPWQRVQYDICDVEDNDLKLEDLPACLSTVVEACSRHVALSDRAIEATTRIKRLGENVASSMRNAGYSLDNTHKPNNFDRGNQNRYTRTEENGNH